MSYKSRQQSDIITRDCFYQADLDRSNTITIYQFYNFLQLVFQRLGIYRQVTQPQCQQLFRFYDDDRNGFLTPNELVDVVWDLYTADVQNDRVAIQQLLEKILLEKYYNRPYNQFDTSNLYGHWGQTNTRGDWRNYRFNPYQMEKMQKFGYNFQKPVNSFQNVGMSSDFTQGGSSLGNFGQAGSMYGGTNGSFGNQVQTGNMSMGTGVMGTGVQVQGNMINLGGNNMGMGGMGVSMGGMGVNVNMGGMGMGIGGMGMNTNMGGMGGMRTQGFQSSQNYQNPQGFQMGGNMQGFSQGSSYAQSPNMQMGGNGMGMGQMGNQGMMGYGQGQPSFHMVNPNSQWGQQQLLVDPFCWQQIPSFNTDPQNIVLPSPSQLQQNQKFLNLNNFGQMTQYLQPQDIQLVTPIRSRQLTQMQVFEAVKQLPYMLLDNQDYSGGIHFKVMFAEFVNLLEDNQFKW